MQENNNNKKLLDIVKDFIKVIDYKYTKSFSFRFTHNNKFENIMGVNFDYNNKQNYKVILA